MDEQVVCAAIEMSSKLLVLACVLYVRQYKDTQARAPSLEGQHSSKDNNRTPHRVQRLRYVLNGVAPASAPGAFIRGGLTQSKCACALKWDERR
eukprot:scaffold309459_cov37-Tisochrysis_lutea.AAC.2